MSDSATPRTAARQPFLSFTISQSLLKLMSFESVMPSNHLILVPFSSCLQSCPASGSFPRSQLFISGGQSNGASALASVLPMNIQDWFLFGWTGWFSLQSKGLSTVFSSTIDQKQQFFRAQPSLWSNSHPYMTTGKNIALTRRTFAGKANVSAFNNLIRLVTAFLFKEAHIFQVSHWYTKMSHKR